MELVHVTENVAYIQGAINLGVIHNNQKAIIIDTGLDRDSGRKIKRLMEQENLELEAIINTHSHADHFGGNNYLARNTQAQIYAPTIESGIIQNPILEPIYLFNGANPIKNLRNKFVLAKPSPVHHIIEPGKLELIGKELDIVSLPGHSYNQIGVQVDNVLFCADTVFSKRVVEKYKIPVIVDIGTHIETLKKLGETGYQFYVPCHTRPTDDITELVKINLETIHKTIEDILGILDTPKTTSETISSLCSQYQLDLNVVQQYYLIRMTIMAYLSYLNENEKIKPILENNTLRWSKQ